MAVLVPLDTLLLEAFDFWVNAISVLDTTNITAAGGTVPSVYIADVVLNAIFKDVRNVTSAARRAVLATSLTAAELSAALASALNVSARQLLIAQNTSVNGLFNVDISGFGADAAESMRVSSALATLDLLWELGAEVEVTRREAYVVLGAQSGVSNSRSAMDGVAQALETFLAESVVQVFGDDVGLRPKVRPSPPTVYVPVTQPPLPTVATKQSKDRKVLVILIACTTVGAGIGLTIVVVITLKKKGMLGHKVLPASVLRARAVARNLKVKV
jgi:hypothetical protein